MKIHARRWMAFSLAFALLITPTLSVAKETSPDKSNPTQSQQATTDTSDLTTNKYYVNKSGEVVHSPTKTQSGKAPAGASAKCRDGTFSFIKHRSGTCSHHVGVADWL
jgi:hypothetical protein